MRQFSFLTQAQILLVSYFPSSFNLRSRKTYTFLQFLNNFFLFSFICVLLVIAFFFQILVHSIIQSNLFLFYFTYQNLASIYLGFITWVDLIKTAILSNQKNIYIDIIKMSNPLINSTLLSNLNSLQPLPLPIFKLIIDQTFASLFNLDGGIKINQINAILKNEQIEGKNWEEGIKSVQYMLKFCYKHEMGVKFVKTFLHENTNLDEQKTLYLSEKYEKYFEKEQKTPKISEMKKINWGAFNLHKSKNKKIINNMYMKIAIETVENEQIENRNFITKLAEFKILNEQFEKMCDRISN